MKKPNPGNFPVVFRIVDGYLLMSAPDFGITVKKRFDVFRKAEEIGNLYLDLVRKIDEELKGRTKRNEKIPVVGRGRELGIEPTNTYSVREVARMLDVSPDTVRRMADEKKIRCRLTRGGHRKFPQAEVDRLLAKFDLVPSAAEGTGEAPSADRG